MVGIRAFLLCLCSLETVARARPSSNCSIVQISGEPKGTPQGACMGSYVLQDRLHDGRPVYRSAEPYHYLYHMGGTGTSARWQISAVIGRVAALLMVPSKATGAEGIGGTWFAGGAQLARSGGAAATAAVGLSVSVKCRAQCKIVSIRGEHDGEAQENAMGDYVLQPRLHDARPVYRFLDQTYGSRFLFYSAKYKSWNIGKDVGTDQFEMFVSNTAFTPDQISGKWKVSSGGSFLENAAVGAQCATSCSKVKVSGLREGELNSDCMGFYVQQPSMNDNKPVYKLVDGPKLMYYSPFYENWNIGEKVGAEHFDMFVASQAKTADKIRGTWQVRGQGGKFAPVGAVRTSCAEDLCSEFTMANACTNHFASDGCGWCHSEQRCASKQNCKVGWSRRAELTRVVTDKQSAAAVFKGLDGLDQSGVQRRGIPKKTVAMVSGVAGFIVLASWCVMLRSSPAAGELQQEQPAYAHHAAMVAAHGGASGAGVYQASGILASSGGRSNSDVIEVSSLLA
eukprot:g2094.t1